MKKRLLSLLLLAAMLVTAVPLAAVAALATEPAPQAAEPAWTEEDYNALYVQEGLMYALDFFTLNEYWADARGTHPAFPVGPSENTAYWYDANKNGAQDEGEVLDLTKDENRYNGKYVVVEMPNSYTYNQMKEGSAVKLYDTYEEALEAARALGDGASAEPPFTSPTPDKNGYPKYLPAFADISDAYKAAAKQWNADEKAWLASYAWKKSVGALWSVVTYSDSNAAKRVKGAPEEHSVFTVEDGYINFRSSYNAGMNGGLLPRNFPTGTLVATVQVGAALGDPQSLSSRVPFIFYNNRIEMAKASNSAKEFTIRGMGSTSAFKLASGDTFPAGLTLPMNEYFTFTQVQSVGENIGEKLYDANLALYTQNRQVFSLDGTYTAATLQESQNYIGFSNVLKAKMYSYRYYADALTINEVAQNHFADLAKWFRLDLTSLGLLDSEDMKAVYAAVANFNFDSDRAEVAAAVLSVAQAKAAEKYASLDAAIVAIAVQYGLDISPLTVQPKGMLKNTYAFLNEGYKTSDDVRADYEAALALDLASTMTAEQYDALYVQNGLKVALDYFASNQYWLGAGAPTSAVDPAYLRLWDGSASYLYLDTADAPMTVKDGYLAVTYKSGTYANLGYTNYVSGNGYDGATAEFVAENVTPMSGQILNLDDIRVSATVSGTTATITAVGQRDSNVGPLARPTATEGELNILKGQTLATFTMAGAMTYALTYKRPAVTQSYYKYIYEDHGNPVKPDAGQGSTSAFYVTHDLVDGVLTKRMKNGKENATAVTYAFHIPTYYDNPEDGKKYIVGYTLRYSNNGIGNGGDALVAGAGTQNFYTADTGEVALMINGATMFNYDDVYFPDSDQIFGGTYLRHTYGSDRNVYAYRQYNRQLSADELAQNHFVDVAKFFRLNITGFEALDAEGKAALYAAVADIDLATSTRTEAQNAVSGVLNEKVDAAYDAMKAGVSDPLVLAFIETAKAYRLDIADVLAAKRDVSTVFVLSFDGLSCNEAQALLDEAYLDAYFFLSYMKEGEDDWNAMMQWCAANPNMAGKNRVDLEKLMALPFDERVGVLDEAEALQNAGSIAEAQAIIDAYVATAMEKYGTGYGEFDYNSLYVTRGLLLAADYFNTNAYWGGTMTVPVNPSENTAYEYNGETLDLTLDENRYNGKWTVNYMENSWTRQRLDAAGKPMDKSSKEHGQVFDSYEAAQLAAYNLANGTTLTELPAGQGSLFATPTAKNGYPAYEVAHDDLSDAFKAAYEAWKKEDRATLKEYVWFNVNEKDLLFFSYDKAGDSRAYVRAMGGPITVSAFRAGDGYITIREDLNSDAGLQTNAKLTNYITSEASTQVIGTLNDKILHNSSTAGSSMSIFYNIRPMVKKSADGAGMVLHSISNFTASDSLPKTSIPLAGVKDMTYTLSGIGTEDPDHFSLRFSDEAWIDVDGAYPGTLNGTTYLGYGTSFGGTKVYALRYYNVALTNEEIAQNHFADLAKFFRIDLTSYATLSAAQLTALYASVADMTFENVTRDEVQAAYDAALADTFAGAVLVEDAEMNAAFLALAAAGKLDLAPIENLEPATRASLVADLVAKFDANYAVNGRVIAYYYEDATYNFSMLTFAGYQVRLDSGSQFANYAGVRAVYDVDLEKIEKICKENGKEVALGVAVVVAGETKATLKLIYEWNAETEELVLAESSNSATGEAVSVITREVGGKTVHSFYYTVTFKGEDFTKELLEAEFAYQYVIAIGDDILEGAPDAFYGFNVTSQNFGDTVTAAEVYGYFYNNGYADDAMVAAVMAKLAE